MYAVNYQRASSVADAAGLARNSDAKFLSGGMTLIPTMKARLASPAQRNLRRTESGQPARPLAADTLPGA